MIETRRLKNYPTNFKFFAVKKNYKTIKIFITGDFPNSYFDSDSDSSSGS